MPRRARAGALVVSALGELDAALRGAGRSIAIATPFMSLPVADRLIRAADASGARSRRLITALNDGAVAGGYLDPLAVEAFLESGFDVRSLRNLHAKVVVVDRKWGIVGSGNMTAAGLDGGNAELGVVLDARQARTAADVHFASWWRAARELDLARLRRVERERRPAARRRAERQGQGGLWRPDRPPRDLPERTAAGGYWLKIMYDLEGRRPASSWRGGTWVSDRHTYSEDGRELRRPTYEVGDHLVVYLSRGARAACPAILRVTEKPVFDLDRVRREGRRGDDERWGWLTEVAPVLTMDARDAPTLAEIEVASMSVRQHSHIRLTHAQYRRAFDALEARGAARAPLA